MMNMKGGVFIASTRCLNRVKHAFSKEFINGDDNRVKQCTRREYSRVALRLKNISPIFTFQFFVKDQA